MNIAKLTAIILIFGSSASAGLKSNLVVYYKMNDSNSTTNIGDSKNYANGKLICEIHSYTVKGNITPDMTGRYTLSGIHNFKPYYKHPEKNYFIWREQGFWNIGDKTVGRSFIPGDSYQVLGDLEPNAAGVYKKTDERFYELPVYALPYDEWVNGEHYVGSYNIWWNGYDGWTIGDKINRLRGWIHPETDVEGEYKNVFGKGKATVKLLSGGSKPVPNWRGWTKPEPNIPGFYKPLKGSGTAAVIDEDYSTQKAQVPGKIKGALFLNGFSDYIDPNMTFDKLGVFRKNFTISCWIKTNNFTGSCLATDLGRGIGSTINFAPLSMAMSYTWQGADYSFGLNSPVPDSYKNQWTMFTCTVRQIAPDKIKVRQFINGTLVREDVNDFVLARWAVQNKNKVPVTSTVSPFIGAYNNAEAIPSNFMSGGEGCSLDNLMIFNKALKDNEILFLFNNGRGREL